MDYRDDLNKFLAGKVFKNKLLKCKSSYSEYKGKECVELKKFWKLLNENGIKTFDIDENGVYLFWYEVACRYASEKSIKQKLGFYVQYGTLNAPRGFKQLLEVVAKNNDLKHLYIEPKDNTYRVDSFAYDYNDIKNYIIKDENDNEIEITKEMYEKFLNNEL